MHTRKLGFLLAIAVVAGTAQAVTFPYVSPTAPGTLDGLIGSGISNENFVVDTYNAITVGVKPHASSGDLPRVGNVYQAMAGDWYVDWAVEVDFLYPGYEVELSELEYVWTLDFNPAAGNTDFASLSFNNPDGLSFGSSTDDVPDPSYVTLYVDEPPIEIYREYYAMSESLGAGYWTSLTEQEWTDAGYTWSNFGNIDSVDPWASGEYEIAFTVQRYNDVLEVTEVLATASMVVQVSEPIPEPASMIALLSLGAGGLLARRFRSRGKD